MLELQLGGRTEAIDANPSLPPSLLALESREEGGRSEMAEGRERERDREKADNISRLPLPPLGCLQRIMSAVLSPPLFS